MERDVLAREVSSRICEVAVDVLSTDDRDPLVSAISRDAEFREALGCQIAGELRKTAVESGEGGGQKLVDALAKTSGLIQPATLRLKNILSDHLGTERAIAVKSIMDRISDVCVFNRAASHIVSDIAEEARAEVDYELLDTLLSRLKNDAKLKDACREHSREQTTSPPFDE